MICSLAQFEERVANLKQQDMWMVVMVHNKQALYRSPHSLLLVASETGVSPDQPLQGATVGRDRPTRTQTQHLTANEGRWKRTLLAFEPGDRPPRCLSPDELLSLRM